jgi:HSP20 family protein
MKNIFKKIAGIDNKKGSSDEFPLDTYDEEYDEEENEDEDDQENDVEINEDQEEDEWLNRDYGEGQLSVDVYQTKDNIIVTSTIAGVKPEDIDISFNNDMLTIRGKRETGQTIRDEDYLYRECYWGNFSRSIILPVEVKEEKIEASLENGVLTIVLPKAKTSKHISIKVKEK